MNDALTWFEIPTEDIARAQKFYEDVLQVSLKPFSGDVPMLIFPAPAEAVAGALVHREQQRPAMGGTTVYLRLDGSVDAAEARVLAAGGTIAEPRRSVPGVPGAFFCLRDLEGNRVGIHGGL